MNYSITDDGLDAHIHAGGRHVATCHGDLRTRESGRALAKELTSGDTSELDAIREQFDELVEANEAGTKLLTAAIAGLAASLNSAQVEALSVPKAHKSLIDRGLVELDDDDDGTPRLTSLGSAVLAVVGG